MTRDDTRTHLGGPAPLALIMTLVLLGATAAGAQETDRHDRYSTAGNAIAPKIAQSTTWGIVDAVSGRVDTVGSLHATMERLESSEITQYGLPKLSHRRLISYDGTPLLIGEAGEVNGAVGTLWGFGFTAGGDYRSMGSGQGADVGWDGDVITGPPGVRRPAGPRAAARPDGGSVADQHHVRGGRPAGTPRPSHAHCLPVLQLGAVPGHVVVGYRNLRRRRSGDGRQGRAGRRASPCRDRHRC